ncbi:MAG: transposase family protein [Burkholderiales bacterium]|nr:transposase family protein [Burkholderiales bacterium]
MDNNLFIKYFGSIEDKRIERTKEHCLLDIMAVILFAIITGALTFKVLFQFVQF